MFAVMTITCPAMDVEQALVVLVVNHGNMDFEAVR